MVLIFGGVYERDMCMEFENIIDLLLWWDKCVVVRLYIKFKR